MSKTDILLETGTNELEILEFFINEKAGKDSEPAPSYFGVNVAKVMQVIESPRLEHKESAQHPCFLGTIPLRGHILPVLDLAVWLGMERAESPFDIVIVTEFSQQVTGFLVSGVTEIHRVGWTEVIPPSGYVSRLGTTSIVGLVDRGDRFIQLLDVESIISDLSPQSPMIPANTVRAGKRYKALVADDSATIRMLLRSNLENANFELHVVNNGREALDYALKMKGNATETGNIRDHLDIIISDIEMPLMDGFTLTKHIKTDSILKDLPVILYSSIITKELLHKGQSVGADDQIAKPEMDSMAEKALALLER